MKNTTTLPIFLFLAALAAFSRNSVEARPRLFTEGLDRMELMRFQMWFILNRACAVTNKYKMFECAHAQQSNTRMSRTEKFMFCLDPIKKKCKKEKLEATKVYKEVDRMLKRAVKRMKL